MTSKIKKTNSYFKTIVIGIIVFILLLIKLRSFASNSSSNTEKGETPIQTSSQSALTPSLNNEVDMEFAPHLNWEMTLEQVKKSSYDYEQGTAKQMFGADWWIEYRVAKPFTYGNEIYSLVLTFNHNKLQVSSYEFLNCQEPRYTNNGITLSSECLSLWKKLSKQLTKKYGRPIKKENYLNWSSKTTDYSLGEPELGSIIFILGNKYYQQPK
jgi:hypothetical protein